MNAFLCGCKQIICVHDWWMRHAGSCRLCKNIFSKPGNSCDVRVHSGGWRGGFLPWWAGDITVCVCACVTSSQAMVSQSDRGEQKVYEVKAELKTGRGRGRQESKESCSFSVSSTAINIFVWQGSAPAFTVNHLLLRWNLTHTQRLTCYIPTNTHTHTYKYYI